MCLRATAPSDAVVLLPSHHYVADEDALMVRGEGAMEAVRGPTSSCCGGSSPLGLRSDMIVAKPSVP
jgi:hypothetical protein